MARSIARNAGRLLALATLLLPAIAAAAAPDAVIGEPVRTVLASETDRTVVQITFPVLAAPSDWASAGAVAWTGLSTEHLDRATGQIEKVPAALGLQVAVGGRAAPTWRLAAQQWYRQPADATAPSVEVGGPLIHRGVPLAPVMVYPEAGGGILAGVIIEIQHPLPRDLAKGLDDPQLSRRAAAEPVPGAIVNAEHYRRLRAASMATGAPAKATLPDHFALSRNWVRLEIAAKGVYAVAGQTLALAGVNLAAVDPASLRLFKGGGLPLETNPEVADGEQAERVGLTEVAIQVDDGADGQFDADDRLLFYGFGTDVWLDRLVADAEPLAHYNHPYQDRGVYWLTWESPVAETPFAGSPRRIPSQGAAPAGAPPVTEHRARYHGEENLVYQAGFVRDRWVWQALISTSFNPTAQLHGVIAERSGYWQVDFCGTSTDGRLWDNVNRTTAWLNSDESGAVTRTWTMMLDQRGQERVRMSGATTSLRAGTNVVRFRHDNFAQSGVHLGFDSFDLLYDATLDKNDYPRALTAVFWGDEITEPTVTDVRFTLPAAGGVTLWDVTSPDAVVALLGAEAPGPPRTLTAALARQPGQSRHLVLFADDDLLSVEAASLPDVRPLRQDLPAADYVVIHPAAFAEAAARLVDLRARILPGVTTPAAVAVSVEDIYANFSGGQKDWRAIRQFLRWYWLAHGQRLQWVCLLGDASRDYRNYTGRNPGVDLVDWIPAEVVTSFPDFLFGVLTLNYPYATDDSLVSLDAVTNPFIGVDLPDLAVGRIPVNSASAALAMVERIRAYTEEPPPGPWRNRLAFCADDLGSSQNEAAHTRQAEWLANRFLAPSLEVDKIYLVDYAPVGLYKPAARRDLVAALDAGTTMFYYVGHGAAQQLADEQVFLSDFIPGLANAGRRFIFVAFSCDVGVYDDPGGQSMAELFLTPAQGGAIASIAASWVSMITPNNALSDGFFAALYPGRRVDPTVTLGQAFLAGKASVWTTSYYVSNARRYNYFGDPALHLVNPVDDLAFAAGSAASLLSGRLHTVRLEPGGAGVLPPNAAYQLLVQESSVAVRYYMNEVWRRPGNTVFRGTGNVAGEQHTIPFVAPLHLRTGDEGRIRLVVQDGPQDRVAFLQVPVQQMTAETGQDVRGPDIRLSFAGGRTRVLPGAQLTASLVDTSGINILASSPANSVLLEFDASGVYNNISDAVVFAPGSYTRASLTTSLPADLGLGPHTLVMTASDMFGNVGSDTLRFNLEAAGVGALRDTAVFPNPTPGPCRLVCDVSASMDLRWDIYTVSGRRIRSIREDNVVAGPVVLYWDGRDAEGDEVANGVYLYVLRGTLADAGHEIRETGQLVIMR